MNSSDHKIDSRLMRRYLEEEATSEEIAAVQAWERQSGVASRLMQGLKDSSVYEPVAEFSRDDVWKVVSSRIRMEIPQAPVAPSISTGKAYSTKKLGLALGIAASLMIFFTSSFAPKWMSPARGASATAPTEYSTANAQRATLRLPDGTKVTLNVASQLLVPRDFGITSREVTLVGQGAFDVSQHQKHPFVVKTAYADAIVLGTEFSVRAYKEDIATRVAVKSGKVSIGSSGAIADAGTVAIAAKSGVQIVKSENAVNADMSFENGILTLDAIRLADAVASLNRWYNIDVQISDASVRDLRITAQLSDRSIDEFVNNLNVAFPVRTERRGRTLAISRKQSHSFHKSTL